MSEDTMFGVISLTVMIFLTIYAICGAFFE